MVHRAVWLRIALLVMLLTAACQPLQPESVQPAVQTTEAQIQSAMSAAPLAVAQDATILGWSDDKGGGTVVLREGSNGWICTPDWPVSPGTDPTCNDPVWTAWNDAFGRGEEPEVTAVGISYMLQGGSDPSHTDPMASRPAPGEDWVNTAPHIMILAPGGFDAADFATEPKQDEPWIMWDGTPYEHLMVPIVPITTAAMAQMDADVQNTLSSAPAGIALNATILANPAKAGDPMLTLKTGTNGWTCWPDRPVSPGNDPSCNNPQMDQAFAAGLSAVINAVGLGYMLQGGSDESNVDPTATGPAPGEDWVTTPTHVMLMVPGGFAADQFTTDHTSGYPYIMFDDTPIEHLMIPVDSAVMSAAAHDHAMMPGHDTERASPDRAPMTTIAQSVVIDGTDHSATADPEQAKAEAEFLAAVMAKEEAYYAEDYATLRSFYADNIVSILPDTPEITGIAAWSEGMEPFLAGHDTTGKLTIKRIWVSGDYASRQAEWEEIVTPKDGGAPFHQIGRCVLNWQKIDGQWKIVSELINYLKPPTEME